VKRAYDSLEQTDKLYGRSFNYWAPLLSVCKVFASERFDELLKLAEEDAEKAEKGDRLSEVEEAVLFILLEEKTETVTVLLKELTQKVQNIVPWVKDWHIVVSALENLGVVQRKYPTSKGVQYQIKLEKVRKEAEKRRTKEKANKKVPEDTCVPSNVFWSQNQNETRRTLCSSEKFLSDVEKTDLKPSFNEKPSEHWTNTECPKIHGDPQSLPVKLERLTTNIIDKCMNPKCVFTGRMEWQATYTDGSWALLCYDCGLQLFRKIQEAQNG
jgi:hypothetical protein